MPSPSFAYWTIATGDYASMFEATIASARRVGVEEDFHVWGEGLVRGAVNHDFSLSEPGDYWFKFECLDRHARALSYEYLIWLDADSYFVQRPVDILSLVRNSAMHASLESDASDPRCSRYDWWGCPLAEYVTLMRDLGVTSPAVYNVNAGFWILRRDAISEFLALVKLFQQASVERGWSFTEEPALAYATHMLCEEPAWHSLTQTSSVWCSDWTGNFCDCLPSGGEWEFEDYFTAETIPVNPAIVHAMRSKEALMTEARRLRSVSVAN